MTDSVEHVETRVEGVDAGGNPAIVSRCTCGASWSHPVTRLDWFMDSIFISHVAYAKRTGTKPD